ncbi:MAG: methyltransferase domain-containing protein [Candidatus Hydrogenedentes bacterium]|nr:methyltransferase domain-containing protein [Candidatus Hydrogenedentota bacterium]
MKRIQEPETMDQPGLAPEVHASALRAVARVNTISLALPQLWRRIRPYLRTSDRPLRILDLATGSGAVPISIARRARRAGLPVEVAGCDFSPFAVKFAREEAQRCSIAAKFFEWDLVQQGVPEGYDIIVSTLFLHHLDPEQIVDLLRACKEKARVAVIISDLLRTRRGLLLAQVGPRLLSRNPVVHEDGVRSARAAYTLAEMRSFTQEAGMEGANIRYSFPERFLLEWRRTLECGGLPPLS